MAVAWVNNAFDGSVATDGTTTAFAFTPTNAFTAGNTVVFLIENGSADQSVSSITDGTSNVYVIHNASIGKDVITLLSVASNPTTVTIHYSVAPATGASIFAEGDQFSGVVSMDPKIKQITNSSGLNPVTTGSFTPVTANNMIYGITDCNATTMSAGTNVAFTLRSNGSVSGGNVTNISTETFLQSGGPTGVDVQFGDSPASSFACEVFWMALSPTAQPVMFIPDIPQVPFRWRQDYGMLARSSKQDEQWPFTAVKTPTQKGFDWDPQFPIRTWHRFRDADEHWPFTAVLTKGPIEWDWRPEFARRRFVPSRSADEEWPFTAVPTPAQFGWQLDPQFPTRRRFHPSRSADEQWPFTATLTPSQFGWQLDPSFPFRLRFRTFQSADDEFPFTATVTPSQMGWPFEPSFPFRVRWQRVRRDEDVTAVPVAATPTWGLDDTLLPSRRRFDPIQSQDDQFPFTATLTPAQFGWDNPEHFPLRRRLPPLTVQDEQWPFTEVPTPAQFGWDNPERFPLRIRFRPILSADEQYPFTAAVTPTQFGWQIEPFFPSRLRFRPLVPAEQLLAPIAGTSTPTNIDFAYPPEFYTERKRYQPLVYEFWQPDIPPVSPTFQIMTGLATKVKARTGATYITVTLQGTGIFMFAPQPTPTIFNEVLPFGSAHIVFNGGAMPVSVALGVSNDGVNFVQLGPAVTQFPNIINLTASPLINTPNLAPFKYHAWIVTGGDISTNLTITELFVGWRA